jgi:hypothetical protein
MTDAHSNDDVAHAMAVLADQDADDDENNTAVVAGYYLVPQSIADGLWGVYRDAGDAPDMIDVLRVDGFKSALEIIDYLQRLDQPGNATQADLDAPEVA